MPKKTPTNGSNGRASDSDTTSVNGVGVEPLIEQAEALKSSLRDTLSQTSELISGLKAHRRQTRQIQSTLASLKQLQSLNV